MRKIDPRHRQARREQIIAAALTCFARRGFHLTRTAEICAEAGMSPGNLFHYFDSKDAIIEAIVEEDQRETAEMFSHACAEADLYAALLRIVDHGIEMVAEPAYTRIGVEVIAEALRSPKVAACVARNEAARKAALVQLLEAGAARGQMTLGAPAEATADWILLLLDGAFGRALVEPAFRPQHYRTMLHSALSNLVGGRSA